MLYELSVWGMVDVATVPEYGPMKRVSGLHLIIISKILLVKI